MNILNKFDAKLINLYLLSFKDKQLESEYRKDNTERHYLSQRLLLLAGIIFFASFAIYDVFFQQYAVDELLIARLGIFTPALLLIWTFSILPRWKQYFTLFASLIVILSASGISYVIFKTPMHLADSYTYGLVLTLVFGFIMIDIRVTIATINYFIISLIYFLVINQKSNVPSDFILISIVLFVSLGFTLIIGRYTIDFYKRIDFLSRKKLEEEKLKVKKSFQREKILNDAKGRFTNVIAHVFRTPLATIQNNINIIEHKAEAVGLDISKETDLLLRSTKNISYNIERAQVIIKFDSGQVSLEYSSFSINALLNEVAHEINQLESLNRIFRINQEEGIDLITSDRSLLKRILLNFASNAAKFSRRNTEIIINCKISADIAEFEIIDSGYGIEKEQLQNIFDIYYHFSTNPMIMGLGLGLAIIKRSADLLNAEVKLESEVNKGTKAYLKLPLNH